MTFQFCYSVRLEQYCDDVTVYVEYNNNQYQKIMLTNLDYTQDKANTPRLGQNLCLKPLKAQVGGHVYMKLLNDSQVCKPLNQREEKFYQNIPKSLLDHVPQFLGTVEIKNNAEESSR